MANNETKKEVINQATTEQVQQTAAPQQETTPVVVQQVVVPAEETGFKGWLKKHWKGVTAALVGAGAAAGSAVVAYKKGKAAGVAYAPQQDDDNYSLDPNN